jgi:hypothetical protein
MRRSVEGVAQLRRRWGKMLDCIELPADAPKATFRE